VLVLWLRRDRIALPLAFSLASFLPAPTRLPDRSLYAENFLYLPLLGLSLASAELLGRIGPSHRSPGALVSSGRSSFWSSWPPRPTARRDLERRNLLFSLLAERFPGYPPAHSGLGVMFIDRAARPTRSDLSDMLSR